MARCLRASPTTNQKTLMHQWQNLTTERDDREAVHRLQAAARDAGEAGCEWLAATAPPLFFWALHLPGYDGLPGLPACSGRAYPFQNSHLSAFPALPLFNFAILNTPTARSSNQRCYFEPRSWPLPGHLPAPISIRLFRAVGIFCLFLSLDIFIFQNTAPLSLDDAYAPSDFNHTILNPLKTR